MSLSKPNVSDATSTSHRIAVAPSSGLCVNCREGCPGLCEVGRSAIRGREVIYPEPFGEITSGSEKDYPVDFSHFNIQGTCTGAHGIEADSDKAIFPRVDVSTEIGGKLKIILKAPFITGALGSTEIARRYWTESAIGAAICGTVIVCGENICGVDPRAEIKKGRGKENSKVIKAPNKGRRR